MFMSRASMVFSTLTEDSTTHGIELVGHVDRAVVAIYCCDRTARYASRLLSRSRNRCSWVVSAVTLAPNNSSSVDTSSPRSSCNVWILQAN